MRGNRNRSGCEAATQFAPFTSVLPWGEILLGFRQQAPAPSEPEEAGSGNPAYNASPSQARFPHPASDPRSYPGRITLILVIARESRLGGATVAIQPEFQLDCFVALLLAMTDDGKPTNHRPSPHLELNRVLLVVVLERQERSGQLVSVEKEPARLAVPGGEP